MVCFDLKNTVLKFYTQYKYLIVELSFLKETSKRDLGIPELGATTVAIPIRTPTIMAHHYSEISGNSLSRIIEVRLELTALALSSLSQALQVLSQVLRLDSNNLCKQI